MPDDVCLTRRLSAALGTRRHRGTRVKPGTPPGTLIVAGTPTPARISVLAYNREGATTRRDVTIDDALAVSVPTGVTWINVDGLGDTQTLTRLGERFGLHPLALEDVLNVGQRPKVERYDKHIFVVTHTMRIAEGEIMEEQVSLFFGPRWLITVQERLDGDCFGPVREAIRQGRGRMRDAGADYLAYLLIDSVVDAYFPVIEQFGERLQHLETAAIDDPNAVVLVQMQRIRHQLLTLRRAVWPLREEVVVLQRDDSQLVTAETRLFLRDVYDHAVQALEIVESLRETAVSVMEVPVGAEPAAQRGDEGPDGHRDDLHPADDDRVDLRNELQAHARARVALRLRVGAGAHARERGRHDHVLQATRLVVMVIALRRRCC